MKSTDFTNEHAIEFLNEHGDKWETDQHGRQTGWGYKQDKQDARMHSPEMEKRRALQSKKEIDSFTPKQREIFNRLRGGADDYFKKNPSLQTTKVKEHALFISGDGEVRISHDKDMKLTNLVKALMRQGMSREEILRNIKRAKELMAMGRGSDETSDSYTGAERRKPRLPYYSLAGQNLIAENCSSTGETCPKCKDKISHGKDGNKPVKVCVPCRKIYPSDQVKESTPFPTKDALAAGFPDVKVGDTIRTRKMSFVGVVTKVVPEDPKRKWTSSAVYFEVEGPPRRTCVTPLSNVVIIKKAAQ